MKLWKSQVLFGSPHLTIKKMFIKELSSVRKHEEEAAAQWRETKIQG
jgi:hypothetical protein